MLEKLEKLNQLLAGIPATLIGGVFLVWSFLCPKLGMSLPVDPAWVTVFISGIPLLYLAIWRTIHNKGISKISSAHLICIAMVAAILIGDLFAAGEVAFIMAIGAILEDMTTDRAKKGLRKLINLAPTQGRRILNGTEEMIPAEEIQKGDSLRILPGETIPVDGKILAGETSVDQSIMTGESLPVDKVPGDDVFCGTINRFGAIDIEATKVGEDSSLQKLIRMVQEAENKKAPMARVADAAASWFVPAALLIAIFTLLITKDLVRAVTILVVFCPCALVLATPTAIMAAIGQATKHGVIIKSGEALENMGKVDTIAFDKTGTLTYGNLEVCDLIPLTETMSKESLLVLAASAEAKSEHPLGKAIVSYARKKGMSLKESSSFQMFAGRGISVILDCDTLPDSIESNKNQSSISSSNAVERGSHETASRKCWEVPKQTRILCGNETFISEYGILLNETCHQMLETLRTQGKASIIVVENDSCIGIIALSDVLRPEATAMVKNLEKVHTKAVLLTGDNQMTADYFAKSIGITEIHANLLPEEKVKCIASLQEKNKTVCMIGDGVNDAPALKTAHVGIAMGTMGSDIAIEAADIALMGEDISKVPYLKRLSNATVKTIQLSITLSMIINLIAVSLSVMGLLNPTTGALVHNAGSCFVVLIAALLYDRKFDSPAK